MTRLVSAAVALLLALAPVAARADLFSSPAPGCPLSGCTFSGAVNTSSANGFQIGGVSAIIPAANGGLPSLSLGSQTVVYDIASGPGNIRQNTIYGDISASVNSSTIWQNFFTSTTLAGPGAANGEITQAYSGFIINAGATSAQAETIELRLDNSGTIGVFDSALSTLHNLAGATAGTIRGIHFALDNANATAGAITNYFAMVCDPLAGAGSEPTNKLCLRNADPNAGIATLGNVNIGTVAQPLATRLLNIVGPDALVTTTPIFVSNSAAARLFSLDDSGGSFFGGGVTLGGPTPTGFGSGSVQLNGATSGFVRLVVASPTLSSVNVTIPNATGTLALLGSGQTWTATQTFSGTLNASGVLQGNGVTAVSCAAASVVLATFVVTNGIVTHC